MQMAELDDVYNTKILELAGSIARSQRLVAPSASASAQSKLCGSTIAVDVVVENGRFIDYGQTVKACLLGQAAASVVGREIVGTTLQEFHGVAETMRAMLKYGGAPPQERWKDLAVLAPVRDYRSRHASTLLVFDAIEKAVADISAGAVTADLP